jgi:DNA-binding transcriptional LysR family regulator
MDRVEEWRVFTAVAGLRSFAQAARRLGKSPQAVTRAVAALEGRLGTRLLHRTTRSVSLTDDGERYLEKSRRTLAELDALEAPLDSTPDIRGTLSITAPVLFGQLHVLPIVQTFLAANAGATIKLSLLDRRVSLAEEGVDLAVRVGDLPDSSLVARQVGHVRTVIVGSPAYLDRATAPRQIDSLSKHSCIAFTGATPIVDRWAFGKQTVAVAPRLVVNTAQAAIDAAVAGLGLTRVISYQVGELVARDALRIVLASAEPDPIPVHIVSLPGALPRIAQSFVDVALPELRPRVRLR